MTLRTRALVAFLVLPGTVAFLVPAWLTPQPVAWGAAGQVSALLPLLLGSTLLAWTVHAFYRAGQGTLAPWSPPRRLVTIGPYRWSRNPMYVAVILILFGWAAAFRTAALLVYAVGIAIAFHLRVVFFEERWLARTHGDAWRRYATRVRRWL